MPPFKGLAGDTEESVPSLLLLFVCAAPLGGGVLSAGSCDGKSQLRAATRPVAYVLA